MQLLFNTFNAPAVFDRNEKEETSIITDGDHFSWLDVFLGEEDCNAGRFVEDGGRVRLARVIHASDTKSKNLRASFLVYIVVLVF